MPNSLWIIIVAVMFEGMPLAKESKVPFSGQSQMANSSKECAVCHIRWVKGFNVNSENKNNSANNERQAASPDMCLSCHDGSVVDSRFKVWLTDNHVTGLRPSNRVQIPKEVFPLDKDGKLTCASCHTAHAIKDDANLESAIFLREPNINSSLCIKCHSSYNKENPGHHPVGKMDFKIPEKLIKAGGITNAEQNQMYCETCHAPHGAKFPRMLILPASELCTSCHKSKSEELTADWSFTIHQIGKYNEGFYPSQKIVKNGALFGPNNELTCVSCHQMHGQGDNKASFYLRFPKKELCTECHQDKQKIFGGEHDPAKIKWKGKPLVTSGNLCVDCHPVHRKKPDITNKKDAVFKIVEKVSCETCHNKNGPGKLAENIHVKKKVKDANLNLPLAKAEKKGEIKCISCHEIHKSDKGSKLLRTPRDSSQLCMECHKEKQKLFGSKHDLRVSAPLQPNKQGEKPMTSGPCGQCHLIHGPAQTKGGWAFEPDINKNKNKGLCIGCHDSIMKHSEKEISIHGAIEKAESCAACHDPHNGELAIFLKQPVSNSCFECHAEPIARKTGDTIPNIKGEIFGSKSIHKPVEKGNCQGCHRGHKSPNPKLLTEKYPIFDYVPFSLENYSLCLQECHSPKILTEEIVDTTTQFRDGNINLHYIHVNQKKSRTCKLCHAAHASDISHLLQQGVSFGPRNWKMKLTYVPKNNGGSCTSACHKEKTYNRVEQQNDFKRLPDVEAK